MAILEGRVALVTGAARGIGRSVALKLAQAGAAVVINDLDVEPLNAVADEIQTLGGEVGVLAGSVVDSNFAEQLLQVAIDRWGRVDLLVNNAGYAWNSQIDRTSDEQWAAMIDVHLTAPFRLCREVVRYWRQPGVAEGYASNVRKIVNVSSIMGTHGAFGQIAYSAAKSGVVGLTMSLARELGPDGINVNAVAFGLIDTRLTQITSRENPVYVPVENRQVRLGFEQALYDDTVGRIPLRRSGTADEAAGAIISLCLPDADYISGQIIDVDGGLSI